MPTWKDFEIECTDFLTKNFGAYATFTRRGGENSTIPDILVQTRKGVKFYIEAKEAKAQCGQFVLHPNLKTRSFDYSKGNGKSINAYAQEIIEHMNMSFDAYRNAGKDGEDIDMENGTQIFSNWIIQTYKEKGARYFIANNFVIFPTEHFQEYFDVTAKYRIKRSGSGNVGTRRLTQVLNHIKNSEFTITDSYSCKGKLFVISNEDLHNRRFIHEQYEYMFAQRGDAYEIRKLSNTYHANVIFSITQIENKSGLTKEEFIEVLNQ